MRLSLLDKDPLMMRRRREEMERDREIPKHVHFPSYVDPEVSQPHFFEEINLSLLWNPTDIDVI